MKAHPTDYPLTAGVTGILLGLVTIAVCLGVLWLALAVGARIALGLAG